MNNKEKIWTLANLISFSRIILAIPLVMVLDGVGLGYFGGIERNILVALIVVLIFLSDILDGAVARWTNQVTNLGKLMDPVADKICMLVVLIHLMNTENGLLFFILFVLICLRDTAIVIVGIYLVSRNTEIFQAIFSGKVFIFLSGIMMPVYIFDYYTETLGLALYILTVIFYFISSYFYFINFKSHIDREVNV